MKKYLIILILFYSSLVSAQFSENSVLQLHAGTQTEMNTMHTTYVGNGRVINEGEITVIQNSAATL